MSELKPILRYGSDGKPRVHSWLGIVSILIPLTLLLMATLDEVIDLQPLVGDVEGFAIVTFGAGTICSGLAVIEAIVRQKRRLLPVLSFGMHMAFIALAAAIIVYLPATGLSDR